MYLASNQPPRNLHSESGMAMTVVIVLLAALLAVGAVTLSLQMNSTKSASLTLNKKQALYCAEAGIEAGQALVPNKLNEWGDVLDGEPYPDWYPIVGDIDNDGVNDYIVTIEDNADEASPLPNDPTQDNDLTVMLISECTKYKRAPKRLMTMVKFDVATAGCDSTQKGAGCQGTSNLNE